MGSLRQILMTKASLGKAWRRQRFVLYIIALYLASHLLPAADFEGDDDGTKALFGWQASLVTVGLLTEFLKHFTVMAPDRDTMILMLGWLPNLLLWGGVACLLIGRWRSERTPGMLAGFSGIAALLCGTVWIQGFILLTGYYVWMASMALLAVAGFCRATLPQCVRPSPLPSRFMD
jgi:hypothetical protein